MSISILEILLISTGLGMDALSVSLCKGLTIKTNTLKKAIIIGLYFGIFQAVMPIIGYYAGGIFEGIITNISHWVAFVLLAIIGINMIIETIKNKEEDINEKIDFKTMTLLAIATSIDALVIGITFAVLKIDIFKYAAIIGIITFIMSFTGVMLGNIFGKKMGKGAELFGGIVLILIGIKIIVEHFIK